MKKCPYCAENIQNEAIKCRYCGSDLTSTGYIVHDKEIVEKIEEKSSRKSSVKSIVGFILSILGFLLFLPALYFTLFVFAAIFDLDASAQSNVFLNLILIVICLIVVNFPMTIGLILSALAIKTHKNNPSLQGKGLAFAGVVISGVNFVVFIVVILSLIIE